MSIRGICEGSPDVEGTTLIKPVTYEDMDRDEREYILECIEIARSSNPEMFNSEHYLKNELPSRKLVGFNTGESDTKLGPVFQVHSINILNDRPTWTVSRVYGSIHVFDNRKTIGPFSVYERDMEDPEDVSPVYNALSLTQTPMAPLIRANLFLKLFTTSDNGQIFPKFCCVDYKNDVIDDCTKIRVEELIVHGKFGYYAQITYSIIPFALIANISMSFQLLKLPNSVFDTLRVGGYIKVNDLQLLKNKEVEFTVNYRKEYVYNVELTRNVVAVAIPSVLSLDMSITKDETEFVADIATIDPLSFKQTMWSCKCKDEKYYFNIYTSWFSPDVFFRLLPEIPRPLTSKDDDNFVEVFSIYIGGGGSTPAFLRGSIVVRDRDDTVYVFLRNDKYPFKLRWCRRTIALAWPGDRWILEKNFYMHMKLKDVLGNQVCRGGLCWYHDDSDLNPKRFDRRMCTVIPGENGYFAAVHYSIFRNGLRARVSVTVDCKIPCNLFDVYGVVCAEYNNYDYSSTYDKEYYRVIIFKRPPEERVKVQGSSSIPLSKSLITAPADCAKLYVHFSIVVRPLNDDAPVFDTDLFAMGKIRFSAGINASQQISVFESGSFVTRGVFTVKVEWVK